MAIEYPVELEQWWVDQARACTGIQDLRGCLGSVVRDVGRLSDAFTIARSARFGDYARDERMLVAYALYFFPQTFVRAQLVLAELARVRHLPPPSAEPLRILDLGSGIGAASFAALMHLAGEFPGRPAELEAVDASEESLLRLQHLFVEKKALWPTARLRTIRGDLPRFPDPHATGWDLVLVSFALNELAEAGEPAALRAWVQGAVRCLSPAGVLVIIEPAGQNTSLPLQKLRDWAAAERAAHIVGPCLHQAPCPMLRRGEGWCHEVRRWRVPESIEVINRRLQRTVQDVKFSFLALARPDAAIAAPAPTDFRIVAPMRRAPGRLTTMGCAADGGLHACELLTRHLKRPEAEAIAAFERGDILRAVRAQTLADGYTLRAEAFEPIFRP